MGHEMCPWGLTVRQQSFPVRNLKYSPRRSLKGIRICVGKVVSAQLITIRWPIYMSQLLLLLSLNQYKNKTSPAFLSLLLTYYHFKIIFLLNNAFL